MLMDNAGFPVSSIVVTEQAGQSRTVQHGAGTYYLKVTVSNVAWQVSVRNAL
jgi:hypothetical protein